MGQIDLIFAGDFIPDTHTLDYVDKGQENEFAPEVSDLFREADLSIVNIETPLTNIEDPILKTGNSFKADPINAELIKEINIDVAALANNHILDYDEKGVLDTISACSINDIDTVGAGKNLTEASKPLIKEIKGKKIGIINFCEHEFSIATEVTAGANPLDLIDNFRQIQELRIKVDLVIIIFHGGKEYHHIPMPNYKKKCEFFIDAGADAVIGHHTHYYSGFSYYKEKPVFYSLGNFYANSKKKDSRLHESYCVTLHFNEKGVSHTLHEINHNSSSHTVNYNSSANSLLLKIKELNMIINDDVFFEKYWNEHIEKENGAYLNSLFSRNRWVYRIRKYFKITKRLPVYQKNILLNMIRCESHHESLLMILKKPENK